MAPPIKPDISHTASNYPNNLDDSSNLNDSNNAKHARLLSQQSPQCTQRAFLCSSLTPAQSLGNHKSLDRCIGNPTFIIVTILQSLKHRCSALSKRSNHNRHSCSCNERNKRSCQPRLTALANCASKRSSALFVSACEFSCVACLTLPVVRAFRMVRLLCVLPLIRDTQASSKCS
jgi:hypothetical protein